jgi:hypothetical protein
VFLIGAEADHVFDTGAIDQLQSKDDNFPLEGNCCM